jgi:hypothetical protein
MQATDLFPIIVVLTLITVEFGGHALLSFITTAPEQFPEPRLRFFRTGHSHAGVLLVLSLVYFLYLPRTDFSNAFNYVSGTILTLGVLMQSGGFFIHLGIGQEGQASLGTRVTRIGAILIAVALIILGVGLIKAL